MKLNKKGFTIVELVIVIAVIAILAAVLIPTFNSVISKANKSSAQQKASHAYTILASDKAQSTNLQTATIVITVGSYSFAFQNGASPVEATEAQKTAASKTVTLSADAAKDVASGVVIKSDKDL